MKLANIDTFIIKYPRIVSYTAANVSLAMVYVSPLYFVKQQLFNIYSMRAVLVEHVMI